MDTIQLPSDFCEFVSLLNESEVKYLLIGGYAVGLHGYVRDPDIEILTSISGVRFSDCYKNRIEVEWDGVHIPLISLADLKRNKRASGRIKDLADLDNL